MALGRYPDLGLKEAREKRDEARAHLQEGVDPLALKQQEKIKTKMAVRTTFRLVADEFIEKMELEGKALATLKKMRWFRDVLEPTIGRRPIADITAHELRPGELRKAQWNEIDFEAAVWRVPAERTKPRSARRSVSCPASTPRPCKKAAVPPCPDYGVRGRKSATRWPFASNRAGTIPGFSRKGASSSLPNMVHHQRPSLSLKILPPPPHGTLSCLSR